MLDAKASESDSWYRGISAIGTGAGAGFSVAADGDAEDVDLAGDEDEGDDDRAGGVPLVAPVVPGIVFGEVAGDGGRV